jgi:hypothetical protein
LSKHFFKISFLLVFTLNAFVTAQDSLEVKTDSAAGRIILLSLAKYSYINSSFPDTITRKRFLWYPLKTIDDLFNYLPGYYLKYMDAGQVNQLSYNQLDHHYTSLMRNGRPLNDLLDGSVDFNLLSRNEIEEIEMTKGYGNYLYNSINGINIINHQVFRYKPYSEISYWQDRFENLYFDGSYHQNLLRKFNFNLGITKNSYDGKYVNSDFDKWQGRFNLNYFPNSRFNSFLYFNYTKIQRGLNEGIDPEKTPLDKGTLFDAVLAVVRNPDAYEIRERFDADLGFIYAYGKNKSSFTKLQLFTSNSFRKYRDEENRPTPNGIFFKDNSHWINYGVKIQQVLKYNIVKGIDIISKTELEYDKDLITSNIVELRKSERMYFIENIELSTKYFNLNTYAKAYKHAYFDSKFYVDYGVKPEIKINFDKRASLTFYGIYSESKKLPSYQQYYLDKYVYGHNVFPHTYEFKNEDVSALSGGASVKFDFGRFSLKYYHNSIDYPIYNIVENGNNFIGGITSFENSGLNAILGLKAFNFELELSGSHDLTDIQGDYNDFPKTSGNVSFSYHNSFFKNKFEVKIGLVSRFWTDFTAGYYKGFYNDFEGRVVDTTNVINNKVKINSNATLDFFIIGKINKAIFGLTFENLLNRLYITSGIYPNQDRGGLLNVISRFNVTWYFLN